jgi:hypothetical protein
MPVLKLNKHNENKEIDFELKYLKSLTIKQRFEMMLRKSIEIAKLLGRNENRKTTEVIKRK